MIAFFEDELKLTAMYVLCTLLVILFTDLTMLAKKLQKFHFFVFSYQSSITFSSRYKKKVETTFVILPRAISTNTSLLLHAPVYHAPVNLLLAAQFRFQLKTWEESGSSHGSYQWCLVAASLASSFSISRSDKEASGPPFTDKDINTQDSEAIFSKNVKLLS